MCGLAGLIGVSQQPELSHQIITAVFKETQTRGTDASGFWSYSDDNDIDFYKEPVASSTLVTRPYWQALENLGSSILLVHCREASAGVGLPHINANNHPFVSFDRTIALLHNGRVEAYDELRKTYQVESDCDSEVLLRIFEHKGFASICGLAGSMAIVVGQAAEKSVWFYRDEMRPLWFVDLRDRLGQILFCSTAEIWQEAIDRETRRQLGKIKLVELPPYEAWRMNTEHKLEKFRVENIEQREFVPIKR